MSFLQETQKHFRYMQVADYCRKELVVVVVSEIYLLLGRWVVQRRDLVIVTVRRMGCWRQVLGQELLLLSGTGRGERERMLRLPRRAFLSC